MNTTTELSQQSQQELENVLLRRVFELVRTVRRFNGIDPQRVTAAWDTLEGAVEEVLQFDGGCMDEEDQLAKLFGTATCTVVVKLCDAYENGYGHGLRLDDLDNELGHLFNDARLNEAYRLGYRKGAKLSNRQGCQSPAVRNEGDRTMVGRLLLEHASERAECTGIQVIDEIHTELPIRLDHTTVGVFAKVAQSKGLTVAQVMAQVLENTRIGDVVSAAVQLKNPDLPRGRRGDFGDDRAAVAS